MKFARNLILFLLTGIATTFCYALEPASIQIDIKITNPSYPEMSDMLITLVTKNNAPMSAGNFRQSSSNLIEKMLSADDGLGGTRTFKYRAPLVGTRFIALPIVNPSGKIITSFIFEATMQKGMGFQTTSAWDSIELEPGISKTYIADGYEIVITAKLLKPSEAN